jgi:hypothetical protein
MPKNKKISSRAIPTEPSQARSGRSLSDVFYPLACGASLLVVFFLAFFPVQSEDIYMYLSLGRLFAATGHFPATDPFLFSITGYHWNILHEWGNHLLWYGLFVLGKWNALIIFKTMVILASAVLPAVVAWRMKLRSPVVPVLILLAGYAASCRFIERASLFSELFTPLVLTILLLQIRRPTRLPLVLPAIFLVWANLHPGFHIGLMLLALWVLFNIKDWRRPQVRIVAIATLASAAACFVNPKGAGGFFFPLRTVLSTGWEFSRQYNNEWMPTLSRMFASMPEVKIFLLLAVFTAALLIGVSKSRPWFETAAFLFLVYLGLSAIRFMPVSAFSLSVLSAYLASRSGFMSLAHPEKPLHTLAQWLTPATLALGLIIALKIAFYGYTTFMGPRHFGLGADTFSQPVMAADFLDAIDLKTPLFNQQDFGCYLAWHWNGGRKIFYHGFVDDMQFYSNDYLAVNRSQEDFDRIVNKYGIGAFMLRRYDMTSPRLPLIYSLLLSRPEWHLVYADSIAMIFLKDLPENREAITRYEFPMSEE